MQSALIHAVDRLDAILATETEALKTGRTDDLVETAGRKSQSLLELTRLTRGLRPEMVPDGLRERLGGLKIRLDENGRMLELHVRASHDISAIIARSIEASESDGTYDERSARRGMPR